jgi:hypothetical protein
LIVPGGYEVSPLNEPIPGETGDGHVGLSFDPEAGKIFFQPPFWY